MYIAMNRFTVARGREEEFENIWRSRNSYLDEVPGFVSFHLLRGATNESSTLFLSHSQWESEAAFVGWTKSDAFRSAHKNAKSPKGVLLGHPVFEGYAAVDLCQSGSD
ncbi:MAG: antibiotic biosynthesis monooxygenase [Pseudomonadota bacterium]